MREAVGQRPRTSRCFCFGTVYSLIWLRAALGVAAVLLCLKKCLILTSPRRKIPAASTSFRFLKTRPVRHRCC